LLEEPIELDSVDSLTFTATYDNSTKNPFNPDPDEFVTWGDQTWEEMAIVFYEVARPIHTKGSRRIDSNNRSSNRPLASQPGRTANEADVASDAKSVTKVDRFFEDLDRDGDGIVAYDEVDRAVQLRLYRRVDRNGDRKIDRQEVLEYLGSK
jgi:hypothetical protein